MKRPEAACLEKKRGFPVRGGVIDHAAAVAKHPAIESPQYCVGQSPYNSVHTEPVAGCRALRCLLSLVTREALAAR